MIAILILAALFILCACLAAINEEGAFVMFGLLLAWTSGFFLGAEKGRKWLRPILALALIALTGCVHEAAIFKALGDNTNSVRVVVTTVYGTLTVERNLPYRVQVP